MVGPYIWPTLHIYLKLWTFLLQIKKYRVHLWCMLGFSSSINSATATTANLSSVNENLAWLYYLILKPLVLKVTGAVYIFELLFCSSSPCGFYGRKISDKMSFSIPLWFSRCCIIHHFMFSCLLPSFFWEKFSSTINKKLNLVTSDRTHCMCMLCLAIYTNMKCKSNVMSYILSK